MKSNDYSSSITVRRRMRRLLAAGSITFLATTLLLIYLMPMAYSFSTATHSGDLDADSPYYPASPKTVDYDGKTYDVYQVPLDSGTRELGLFKKGREQSTFVDAQTGEMIEWSGRWRTLERVQELDVRWENFPTAFGRINFGRLFGNTLIISVIGVVGTLASSILVAYGFSRFHFPGKGVLFAILIGTIILPTQVTMIPTYALFTRIGWTGTWLPLIVPHFFANAYNVFLLRQFFMGIPREMDEAAMIDGASPFRTLVSVILPQAVPALVAVGIFHFFWSWNEFFTPLIYLTGKPELYPLSIGLQQFNGLYAREPFLTQAASLMAIVLPFVVFFFTQRFFMQGVVVTGVEK